jgi:hypothetical protein
MFDLSDVSSASHPVANYLLRLLGLRRGRVDTTIGASTQDEQTASRCFQEIEPGRPTPFGCAEFYQPDGRLIWEEAVNADV